MVERRVTHRWIGASFHHWGSSWSRMRGYTTPPYMFLLPGNGPRSRRITRLPARASTSAAQDPAGPAPTTMTSASAIVDSPRGEHREELGDHFVGVAHDRQVGELHHRAVGVGVD